jgi:hypothetical protein
MKTYFSDIIPKIRRFSQKMDDLTLLTNYQWVMISDIGKTTYIFRSNNELLTSINGIISRGRWEYLNHRSLLIESNEGTFLLSQEFTNEETLILSLDGSENYAFFINESKFEKRINTIQDLLCYLEKKYVQGIFISSNSRYYFVEHAREYGPYSLATIKDKVRSQEINPMCFIREESRNTYDVRIRDLLENL